MYRAILGARKSIYWELYIFIDDEAGNPFFDVLEQKARAGVEVKLVVDSLGSFWLSKKRVQSLQQAGVDVRFFNQRRQWYRGWWKMLWSRTHRKILIVDENIGFIGGVNIQQRMQDWLDIHVRLEGKVVRSLLRTFAKTYLICGGDKESVGHLLKYNFRVEQDEIDFIYDEPHDQRSQVRKKYTEAILKARERIILFSPYYAPDKKFLYALWKARQRGVKVDLLIPFRSDHRLTTYLAYARFNLMQRYGVKIHLLKGKMFHGKGMIVDDKVAFVGSSNLDHGSFYDNYEANLRLWRKPVVKALKKKLERWLVASMEFDPQEWAKRGHWHRANEWLAMKLYKLWYGDK